MEVESELPLPACAAATATGDLRGICDLHPSSRQRQILNPLSEARDRACILTVLVGLLTPCHDRSSGSLRISNGAGLFFGPN